MKNDFSILCIDDNRTILMFLENLLKRIYKKVYVAEDSRSSLGVLKEQNIDLVILDLMMPDVRDFELLEAIKKESPHTSVIILTGYSASVDNIVRAIKIGAEDYILKPIKSDQFLVKIDGYLNDKKNGNINCKHYKKTSKGFRFDNFIGESKEIKSILSLVKKILNIDVTVLIQGESGTGKEQIAKGIHYNGNRAEKMFLPIDLGSISMNLIESELFGFTKGSFTGAGNGKTGLIKSADQGTVFFDEIGELPFAMQTKLLRVLQEKEVRPIGGIKAEKIQSRIIVATNKNLSEEVKKGNFREDLFYRLNVFPIYIPPLRERKDDIPLLIDHFLKKHNFGDKRLERLSSNAMEAMSNYSWPGNVRELENCIERAIILCDGPEILINDLPHCVLEKSISKFSDQLINFEKTLDDIVKDKIINTLVAVKGNKSKAAKILGLARSSLNSKISRFSLEY